MQSLNDAVMSLALSGRGYNNCCDFEVTGEAKFLRNLAKENPKLCIDIEANKGDYSKIILEETESKTIAFEPLPKPFEQLERMKLKYETRFICENIGLSDSSGTLDFFFGDSDSQLASFSSEVNEIEFIGNMNINKMKVPVSSLDLYIGRTGIEELRIDLIKIDTEGFEYKVLKGAQKTIEKFKPKYIQLEFNWHQLHLNQTLKSISELLPNYELFQLLPFGDGIVARDANRPETNIFYYSNFVFKLVQE